MSIVTVDGLVPELKKLGERFGKKFEAFFSVHGWKANTNKCRGKVQQGSECCACLHGLLFNYLYSAVSTFFCLEVYAENRRWGIKANALWITMKEKTGSMK